MPAFTDFRYILHENGETRNAMWRKRGKDSLPILPFLPCLLSKNSYFCAKANQSGGVNRNRQIDQNCGIIGYYSNKNLIKSKNLFAVKTISNLVQRLARCRIWALISIGRLCMIWGIKDGWQLDDECTKIFRRCIAGLVDSIDIWKPNYGHICILKFIVSICYLYPQWARSTLTRTEFEEGKGWTKNIYVFVWGSICT